MSDTKTKREIFTGERLGVEFVIPIPEIVFVRIHKDKRGEINCFYNKGTEYTILTTKKGFARGGCIHKLNNEYFTILKGSVEYHIINPMGRQFISILCQGTAGVVPRNYPHYLIALEDAITLEWGALPKEKKEKHKPTRRIVDKINENNIR